MSQKCTATTKNGAPCRAWAVRTLSQDGREPPRCAAHRSGSLGDSREPGATGAIPPAEAAGAPFYAQDPADVTIDQAIAGLVHKMARLDRLIDAHQGPNGYLIELFQLYTQASTRLAGLLRERRALTGEDAGELEAIHNSALDHLNARWGTEL